MEAIVHKNVISIAVLLVSLAFLSACGQKGPLFLPGNPSQMQAVPPLEQEQTNPEPDDEDEEQPRTNRN